MSATARSSLPRSSSLVDSSPTRVSQCLIVRRVGRELVDAPSELQQLLLRRNRPGNLIDADGEHLHEGLALDDRALGQALHFGTKVVRRHPRSNLLELGNARVERGNQLIRCGRRRELLQLLDALPQPVEGRCVRLDHPAGKLVDPRPQLVERRLIRLNHPACELIEPCPQLIKRCPQLLDQRRIRLDAAGKLVDPRPQLLEQRRIRSPPHHERQLLNPCPQLLHRR